MYTAFNETLRSWHNFYFMTGGASAALLGLMFVALSLGMNLISGTTRSEFRAFVTPSVIYFVAVLLICGVMLAPAYEPLMLELILCIGGVVGLGLIARSILLLIRTAFKNRDFILSDWLGQVLGPVVGFGLLLVGALEFYSAQTSLGFLVLWIATILLLLCAIANTWSLVIWIIEHRE
jgi:hypothetical protein